ncbi:MAG TPA: DUF1206 domain-containing protein [Thermoanaerobaculia bacterium]|nr:DUF1206 domain-containing protein [Thermoanaerobaculia bacterium]
MGNGNSQVKSWIVTAGRLGYAAKGVVYGLVGVLAAQAALTAGGAIEGSEGAIRTIGSQPFGKVLLALTGVALIGYVVWRITQAVADTEDKGSDAKGLAFRFGMLVSAATYASMAWFTLHAALFGDSGSGGSGAETWSAELMSHPFGRWMVGLVGVVFLGVGLHHFRRVWKASFMDHYEHGSLGPRQRTWMRRIGRFGLAARGVTFTLIGWFFVRAAWRFDPDQAGGLEAALESLAGQPYGVWLLAVTAFGFIAYGIYCFSRTRYRRFEL